MRNTNNKYYLNTLEKIFSKDFSSPISPVLAEFYFKISKYEKAKKVCEISLKQKVDHSIVSYILAKIYILEDNYIKSEQMLQNIVNNDPTNFQALKLFINVKILLQRSAKTYSKYILKAYSINSKDKKIQTLYNKLKIKKSQKTKKTLLLRNTNSNINLNKKLATKTMYSVFFKQKKYEESLKLLKMMKKTKLNKDFIQQETNKLKNLIK